MKEQVVTVVIYVFKFVAWLIEKIGLKGGDTNV